MSSVIKDQLDEKHLLEGLHLQTFLVHEGVCLELAHRFGSFFVFLPMKLPLNLHLDLLPQYLGPR